LLAWLQSWLRFLIHTSQGGCWYLKIFRGVSCIDWAPSRCSRNAHLWACNTFCSSSGHANLWC
jgi:hypothetical protein